MSAAAARCAQISARLNWPRVLGYGVLWGIAASALGTFEVPVGDMSRAQLLQLEARLVPTYCLQGIALASLTMALEHRLTWPRVAAMAIGFALLSQAVDWLFWKGLEIPGQDGLPSWAVEPNYIHSIWHNLVDGGLFIAAYRLSAESERSRRLFAQAEIARQQSKAWLGAERVRALQGQIDPALLLRVMVELQRRYAHDGIGMQRLLDSLVSFLRAAMPGVRSGASTLSAEVLLARQYVQLRAELEPDRSSWRIRVDESIPDAPFPALLLLPVLDQLIGDGTAPGAELCVSQGSGQCRLILSHAAADRRPWLTPELRYRLQVGLRTLFGDAWTLTVREHPATPAFALTLPLRGAATRSFPHHQETTHG